MTVSTARVPTAAAARPPALVPTGLDETKPALCIVGTVALIGSRPGADIRLESPDVSHAHAVVVNAGGRVTIRDLASRTHVYVNGRRVHEAVLEDGDYVNIGRFALRFSACASEGAAASPEAPTGPATLVGEGLGPGGAPIDGRICVVGSGSGGDLVLKGSDVSFVHAVIYRANSGHLVRDMGSRNGTFVDGLRVVGDAALGAGSVIRIGRHRLRYELPAPKRAHAASAAASLAEQPAAQAAAAVTECATSEPAGVSGIGAAVGAQDAASGATVAEGGAINPTSLSPEPRRPAAESPRIQPAPTATPAAAAVEAAPADPGPAHVAPAQPAPVNAARFGRRPSRGQPAPAPTPTPAPAVAKAWDDGLDWELPPLGEIGAVAVGEPEDDPLDLQLPPLKGMPSAVPSEERPAEDESTPAPYEGEQHRRRRLSYLVALLILAAVAGAAFVFFKTDLY